MYKTIDLTAEQIGRKGIDRRTKIIQAVAKRKSIKYKTTKEMEFTERERGWLEGIIDGEGHISIHKHFVKNNRFQWIFRLCISNTNLDLCKKIGNMVNGRISITPENKEMNHKTSYVFYVYRNNMKNVLSQLKLVAKEKQRKLILEALILSDNIKYVKDGYNLTRPKEHDEKMENIWKEIKKLNRRGVKEIEIVSESKIKPRNKKMDAEHAKYIRKRLKKILNGYSHNDKKIKRIKNLKKVNPDIFMKIIFDRKIYPKWNTLANGYMDKNEIKFNKKVKI